MIEQLLPAGPLHQVRVRCTGRAAGSFHPDGPPRELAARRRALAAGEWTWLRQVHGSTVVEVDEPGSGAGATGDASLTEVVGAVLAIQSADCAPVVLVADGALAVVHAGWRGILAGVIPEALRALRARSDSEVHALLGPCISASAYEFGADDLDAVAAAVGDVARSRTADGRPALDLAAAVQAQCLAHGATSFGWVTAAGSTAVPDTSDPVWFSHRTRADEGRQVTVAWLEST